MKIRTWWSTLAIVAVAAIATIIGFAMSGGSSSASPAHRSVVPTACGLRQTTHAVSASPRMAIQPGQMYSLCSRQIKGSERQRATSLNHR